MTSAGEPPRLQALIESTRSVKAVTVSRVDWGALDVESTQPVRISAVATPLGGVEQEASVVAPVAAQTRTGVESRGGGGPSGSLQ